jgi:hypothetical protein
MRRRTPRVLDAEKDVPGTEPAVDVTEQLRIRERRTQAEVRDGIAPEVTREADDPALGILLAAVDLRAQQLAPEAPVVVAAHVVKRRAIAKLVLRPRDGRPGLAQS